MADQLVNSRENAQRIARVEASFGGGSALASLISNATLQSISANYTPALNNQSHVAGSLATPGRVLIGEGILIKSCRKRFKRRQFFLFNDILIYGTIVAKGTSVPPPSNAVQSPVTGARYIKPHVIPLEEVQLESLDDATSVSIMSSAADGGSGHILRDSAVRFGRHNGWLIKTRAKSFAVYAATAAEKRDWMTHIEKCVRDLLAKTGKLPSMQHAPVWIPDSDAVTCMVCNRSTFNLVNRRHHCRQCGRVVCGSCSSHKLLIPHISPTQSVRVCSDCYVGTKSGDKVHSKPVSRSEGVQTSRPISMASELSTASDVMTTNQVQDKQQQGREYTTAIGDKPTALKSVDLSSSESTDDEVDSGANKSEGDDIKTTIDDEETSFYDMPTS